MLDYCFSIIDSTKFANWNKDLIEFHLLVRKALGTIYPAAIAFGSNFATSARAIVEGKGGIS